jgi:tetratricopeptide (TPR) repeat protein
MLDEQGQWNQAIDEYKKALETDPDNSLIYSEIAETYWKHNRVREAVEAAEKAVQVDADNVEAHKLLSTVYTNMVGAAGSQQAAAEAIDKAIHEFEEITRIDSSERQAFLMLGRLYQVKGEPAKAAEIYKRFLGVEPGSEDGILAMAELQIDTNNSQDAGKSAGRFPEI